MPKKRTGQVVSRTCVCLEMSPFLKVYALLSNGASAWAGSWTVASLVTIVKDGKIFLDCIDLQNDTLEL